MKSTVLLGMLCLFLVSCEKQEPPLSKLDKNEVAKRVRNKIKELKTVEDSICQLRYINKQTDIDSLIEVKRAIINEKIRRTQKSIK